MAEDGAIEFISDRKRSNPVDFDAHWCEPKPSEISIATAMPLFSNEESLRVGFLTAAYGLWFKNFGYSFVLQSAMNIVRQQILSPQIELMPWNYLIEVPTRGVNNLGIGIMRFGLDYFPIALVYDHLVILPSAKRAHPQSTTADQISKKLLNLGEQISPRYQHRCVGPAVLICDGQEIILPDLIPKTTIPPQYCWLDQWD